MNENNPENRSIEDNASPAPAGSGGTVDLPPTVRPAETTDEPSMHPGSASETTASGPAVGETAAANVAVLLRTNPKSPLLLLNAARCYATCAATSTGEARKDNLTKALDSVRVLLTAGYADRMVLRTDPDLAAL